MAKVICKLQNAADEISGIAFTKVDGGMLSEDISDEQAARFASIPGYELVNEGPSADEKAAAAADAAAAEADELKALTAEAVELGIEFKPNWKNARLKTEIDKAKAAAAEAAAAADAAKK